MVNESATRGDRRRQLVVVLAEIFCVVGTLVGVGVLGTAVAESSGGALAADATLLAPATPAFSIWTPIYLGLLGYTIWQLRAAQATSPRHRAIGYLAAITMVLNALWLLVTQRGWIWVSVIIILALAITLARLIQRLNEHPIGQDAPNRTIESLLVDTTFGLYLGWVTVATCANITAAGIASDLNPAPQSAAIIAVLVLAAAAAVGVLLARRLGGREAIAIAMTWGLGWIAVGRLSDEPHSLLVGGAAILAAIVVLAANAQVRVSRKA